MQGRVRAVSCDFDLSTDPSMSPRTRARTHAHTRVRVDDEDGELVERLVEYLFLFLDSISVPSF